MFDYLTGGWRWEKLGARTLVCCIKHVSDQIVSVLCLLQTTESHLGTWDVLLWVFQVVGHSLSGPLNTCSLISISVRVTFNLTRVSREDTMKVWTNLVWSTSFDGVALCTSSLEESSTLLCGTFFVWSWHCYVMRMCG